MLENPANNDVLCLAVDAMGGDNAPYSVIAGAAIFIKEFPAVKFIFCGNEKKILPLLKKFSKLQEKSEIIHTTDYISSGEKPSVALRKGKNSSMRLAIEAVKNGEADAIISSGNTGALMVMSKLIFRPLDGIDRPAIGTILPTKKGSSILLDMGANSSCDATNLAQFAIMGDAFAKATLNKEDPSIGLLNIGSEELKGHEVIRVANQILNEEYTHLNYYGYVEGDDIMKGTADVIVTDGFTGNIALKSIEGTAKVVAGFLKTGFKASIISRIGFLLCALSLRKVFKTIDPRSHNGAMFLGLNGICVKSHGNADKIGFSNALKVTARLVKNQINNKIIDELKLNNNGNLEK